MNKVQSISSIMENIQNQSYYKVSPLAFLRTQNKNYTREIKRKNRRIKKKKHLISEIYQNHNIFHHSSTMQKRRLAQNIIWQRNYELKMSINLLKEENNSVKAKLWNIEKQNRKMDRQIQTWNLTKLFKKSNKKPYIDMATVEKVFGDQDYSIVSKKMEILEEEKLLNEKDLRIKQLQKRKAEIEKYRSHLNSMLIESQVQVFRALGKDDGYQFEKKKEEVGEELMKITHEIDLVFKNIEIKKKARQNYYNNLLQLSQEYEQHKQINHQQIQKLKLQTRKMREQDLGCIRKVKKEHKQAEKETFEYECFLQEQMGQFIKRKLQLQAKLSQISGKIKQKSEDSPKYFSKYQPLIRQFLTYD